MASVGFKHTPFGDLAIISMNGCQDISAKVDNYLRKWRKADEGSSFIIDTACPRFGSGEGKAVIHHTLRGLDVYIICDCFNYGVTYTMCGMTVPMSPDDHYADLKRIIAAMGGKARRITVIMPMLYEGRQHRRNQRESLDCALMLQELQGMGVQNILTFDAHDPRIVNAIPMKCGFDNVEPHYQMIRALLRAEPSIRLDKENAMIISPDEGAMSRCVYYASVLGIQMGVFYKRRDYSRVVNGKNPIIAHDFLGDKAELEGKNVIVVDDMISSGGSMLDIAQKLKEMKAAHVYVFSTFGLFVEGLDKFDDYHKRGLIDKVFTTNLVYSRPDLLERDWYVRVDMSKYIAYLIDTLNYDNSISGLLDPGERIKKAMAEHNAHLEDAQLSL